jgi:hypothetical protein
MRSSTKASGSSINSLPRSLQAVSFASQVSGGGRAQPAKLPSGLESAPRPVNPARGFHCPLLRYSWVANYAHHPAVDVGLELPNQGPRTSSSPSSKCLSSSIGPRCLSFICYLPGNGSGYQILGDCCKLGTHPRPAENGPHPGRRNGTGQDLLPPAPL